MKRYTFAVIISVIIFFGCGDGLQQIESDYTIKVTGTTGVNFKGNYSIPGTSGFFKPANVSGIVPAEYRAKGYTVICVFRKADAAGTLKIEILKGETVISSSETSEPFGVLTMGKMPNQEGILNFFKGRILDVLKI